MQLEAPTRLIAKSIVHAITQQPFSQLINQQDFNNYFNHLVAYNIFPSNTHRSSSIFPNHGSFYSKSSKQTTVATSSTHAEIKAMYNLIQELQFLHQFCQELHIPLQLPILVYEDNASLIHLAYEDVKHIKRCKHFLMLIHYIKEHVNNGLIRIVKVDSKDNRADLLTKELYASEFQDQAHCLLQGTQGISVLPTTSAP